MKELLVVVCTPDFRRDTAQRCLDSLKSSDLSRAELMIIDNCADPDFCHPETLESILRSAGSRPVIFVDDDVEFRNSDWIDRMTATAERSGALVVGCEHHSREDVTNHVGVLVYQDGTTEVLAERPAEAREALYVPAVSSAVVLITRPGQLHFDTSFAKYQHDLDICMQAWNQGERVACCSDLQVVHVMGEYASTRPEVISSFWTDAAKFSQKWGEYAGSELYQIPELAAFARASRGTNWLVFYRDASSIKTADPALASRHFQHLAADCPDPTLRAGANFHLYGLEGDPSHLEACLELEPGHQKARQLLDQHTEGSACVTQEPSSSQSASREHARSAPKNSASWGRSPTT